MQNCESLLEQQHTIHSTVEVLKTTLAPFTDVEEVSVQLGIPIDARGGPIVSSFGKCQHPYFLTLYCIVFYQITLFCIVILILFHYLLAT